MTSLGTHLQKYQQVMARQPHNLPESPMAPVKLANQWAPSPNLE